VVDAHKSGTQLGGHDVWEVLEDAVAVVTAGAAAEGAAAEGGERLEGGAVKAYDSQKWPMEYGKRPMECEKRPMECEKRPIECGKSDVYTRKRPLECGKRDVYIQKSPADCLHTTALNVDTLDCVDEGVRGGGRGAEEGEFVCSEELKAFVGMCVAKYVVVCGAGCGAVCAAVCAAVRGAVRDARRL